MKSGYVDENNLWKLSFKNEDAENIFYQRSLPKTSDNVQIAILFDNSGSMSQSSANLEQSRICICNKIAVVLNEVVKSLTNVKIDFYSFSDRNFYSFEKDVYAIANQNPMGSTNEGLALAKTVYNMETFRVNNPEKFYGKRYLFAVGDGYTNPEDVHKTLEFMRNNTNIRFFHFGIDNAYTPEYGKMLYGENNFTIIPSSDLMYHLCTAIVKLLS
jgi:hypothetical protein